MKVPIEIEVKAEALAFPLVKKIGERIKAAREKKEITQSQLCAQTGTSKNILVFIETGYKINVTFFYYAKVCAALGIDFEVLLTDVLSGSKKKTKSNEKILSDMLVVTPFMKEREKAQRQAQDKKRRTFAGEKEKWTYSKYKI